MLHRAVLWTASDVAPKTHLSINTRMWFMLFPLGWRLLYTFWGCIIDISVGQPREDRCLPRLERVDIVDLIVILQHVETGHLYLLHPEKCFPLGGIACTPCYTDASTTSYRDQYPTFQPTETGMKTHHQTRCEGEQWVS